jgi:hypothetical protein
MIVVVSIFGGIGNQMFQYAFGKSLAVKLNAEFKYDYSYNLIRTDFNPSDIQSIFNLFNLPGEQALKVEIEKFIIPRQNYKISKILKLIVRKLNFGYDFRHIVEKSPNYDRTIFDLNNINLYLSGYWQSEKYFTSIADSIKRDFKLSQIACDLNRHWSENIEKSNSVSIHLRGRDYISNTVTRCQHFICDLEYYSKAIRLIKEKCKSPCFYVFSDDPIWAKEYLIDFKSESFTFITGNEWNTSPISDMYLMSLCKHNIIANSSFSWWAAWLNENSNKTIICPKKWHNERDYEINDLIPLSWIKI